MSQAVGAQNEGFSPTFGASSVQIGASAALRSLVGLELIGARQVAGAYPGRGPVSDDELAAHFAGEVAIALRCGNGKGRSRWLAIDVDARAPQRIPLVLEELRRRGYGDATVVTEGSDPGRGKVIVFFRVEQPSTALRALAGDVLRAARDLGRESWGIEAQADVAVFPQRGEGGLVRIGGRNIGRNGPLERFCNAWGEPVGLGAIAPSTVRLRAVQDPREALRTSPRQAWVRHLERGGLTWATVGGTKRVNALLNRLAFEVARTHGTGEIGEIEFFATLGRISAASPDLSRPSPKNRDRRHPLAASLHARTAWRAVCKRTAGPDTTFPRPRGDVVSGSAVGVSRALREVAALLETIVQRRGLNPAAFEVSYGEIAAMLGISAQSAHERVVRAEKLGLLARLDPGLSGSGGQYTGRPGGGAKTLYALPHDGKNLEQVVAAAQDHHALKRRRAFVAAEKARIASGPALRRDHSEPQAQPRMSDEELLAYAQRVCSRGIGAKKCDLIRSTVKRPRRSCI